MDHQDRRRKRRRSFEPGNLTDRTDENASNTGASRLASVHTDSMHSNIHGHSSSSDNLHESHSLEMLTNMGFNIKKAKEALKSAGGDVAWAVDRLFSHSSAADDIENGFRISTPRTTNDDDEALAQQLQAEYDRPESTQTDAAKRPERVDSGIVDDEAYARSLQAEFDGRESVLGGGSSKALHNTEAPQKTDLEPPLQPGDVEDTVRSIADAINGVKCLNCRKYIVKNESHILNFSKYVQNSEGQLIAIPCQSCRDTHNDKRARLYMIWALLCDFDANSKHNKPDKRRSKNPAKRSTGSGTGYSGRSHYGADRPAGGKKTAAVQLSDADDVSTAKLMNTLHALLPTFEREDEFELDAKQLQALFLCSSLLEQAAELLRNNDLEEVTTQRTLYDALARLLQTLAMHPSTSALVFGKRVVRSSGASLLKISLGKASLAGGKEVDTVQPLSQCLQEFTVQCSMMLSHGADANEMRLFRAFIDLRDFLQAKGSSSNKAMKTYKNAWHKEYAVSEVPDEYILPSHCFVSKAQASDQLVPGRMKRIMQELSRLQTSLPEGIFVRYGLSRPDVMKIVIIGPQGTPYENGLFEFDLLCGNNFPTGPPQMQLRTTGGGAVRFNPNLYNCGKVCLSLLGTWAGEAWDPRTSTLLQVLVSIQAMIFCDHPWFNEPGRGKTNPHNQQSITYNKSLQPHTVQHAMLDWLEDKVYQKSQNQTGDSRWTSTASREDSIWDAIVQNHFRANEGEIRATISKWTTDMDSADAEDLVPFLRAAIPKLQKKIPRGGQPY